MTHHQFLDYLNSRYPLQVSESLLSPNIIAPDIVSLPASVLQTVDRFVKASFTLRELPAYQEYVTARTPEVAKFQPQNYSALMSYDFHLDENGSPRLIEINTNAAFSLILESLFSFHGLPAGAQFEKDIVSTFREELRLSRDEELQSVAIVDDRPEQQKLYVEFLLYREQFRKNGIAAEILDTTAVGKSQAQLIYNRDTDFYFAEPRTQELKRRYLSGQNAVSPNPHEYALLADKDRLLDFTNIEMLQGFGLNAEQAKVLNQVTLKTFEVNKRSPDEIWDERKKWFFKPRHSFGSKAVYRGSSMSRSVYQNILQGDYLAQEFVPPGIIELKRPAGVEKMKFDLRFYVYRDKIQLVGARLFQGQVTNFQDPGGGFAPVVFV